MLVLFKGYFVLAQHMLGNLHFAFNLHTYLHIHIIVACIDYYVCRT